MESGNDVEKGRTQERVDEYRNGRDGEFPNGGGDEDERDATTSGFDERPSGVRLISEGIQGEVMKNEGKKESGSELRRRKQSGRFWQAGIGL